MEYSNKVARINHNREQEELKLEEDPSFFVGIDSIPLQQSTNTATVAASLLPSPIVFLLSVWKVEALPFLPT